MTNQKKLQDQVAQILNQVTDIDEVEDVDDGEVLPDVASLLSVENQSQGNLCGQILGHWTIKEPIGHGGMSTIYLAERNDQQLKQTVVLKVLAQGLGSETMIQRFQRERQILSDLNHQNIAKLYDVGVTETGMPWLIMEWVRGQNILRYADANELNIEQKLTLFIQVCEAMAYAHSKGVIHRDIKPGNILVTDDHVVKLLDFGIATTDADQALTMTGAIMGTPGYMSPEQAKGLNQEIDRRSDIFSAGVLLYKLIKGDLPFNAVSISEISYKIIHEEPTLIGQQVSSDIQAIIFKCLEKHVDNRYQSFKQLKLDLEAYLSGEVVSAKKVTTWGRLLKKSKKNKLMTAVLVGAVLATILGITYGVHQSIESKKKVELTKKYLAKTAAIKSRIRLIHMLPYHDVQQSYLGIEKEINDLWAEISQSNFDDEGLSEFAIGAAYFDMRKEDQAWQYLQQANKKGYASADLDIYLGILNANQWQQRKNEANAIENDQQRESFLQQAREQYYQPAIEYLSRAQKEQAETTYLMAHVAYVEERLEQAIELALKESKYQPWHYEALLLVANAYSQLAIAKGAEQGHDSNVELLTLSNEYLHQAMEIGGSDPKNHSQRCQFAGRDIGYQKFFNYKSVEQIYQNGLSFCEKALDLNPEKAAVFHGMFQLHQTRAEYQEYTDRVSLNKYNDSVSDEALAYYKQSLETLQKGLAIEPDHFEMLLHQIKPLYTIAFHTYLNGGDPMPFYEQALAATEQAAKLNVLSSKPVLQKAYIYSELSYYFMTVAKDLNQAEMYAIKAIEAAQQAYTMNPVYTNVIRVNAYRYSLANVEYEQGEILSATNTLRTSIRERFEILPRRVAFFKNFNDIMRAQGVLLGLLSEINEPIEAEVEFGADMINLVCSFDGLLEAQKQQLKTLIKPYSANNWVQSGTFSDCLNTINTQ